VDDNGDIDDVDTLNVDGDDETTGQFISGFIIMSVDHEEYVPIPDDESDDDEVRDAVGSKRKTKVFTSTLNTASSSTSAAAPAIISVPRRSALVTDSPYPNCDDCL